MNKTHCNPVVETSPNRNEITSIDVAFYALFAVGLALLVIEIGKCLHWWENIFK